ncbi:MAG: acyl-CoA dehydrogenase, partial [Rhodospirillales bacterium]|nr:acyl-CoA dehydrogenase [Rhodospirillales bacterium]
GYPGLVFHAPLTAIMLLDLANRHCGVARLSNFSYRAISPLFDTAPFTISLRREGKLFRLWALTPEGRLAMTASAEFID